MVLGVCCGRSHLQLPAAWTCQILLQGNFWDEQVIEGHKYGDVWVVRHFLPLLSIICAWFVGQICRAAGGKHTASIVVATDINLNESDLYQNLFSSQM